MTLTEWVTRSCSSRAILARSARNEASCSRELLESVEASGRAALEELRRLLGLLSDGDGAAPLAPQPGVTEIPTLVDQVRQAGVDIELCVEGQPRNVPGGVSVTAYRIVQEALTNVLKHGGGAPTRVIVRWANSVLELEVIDDGSRHSADDGNAKSGRGIAGMRERAAMYGGTLDARPGPQRGYIVRGRIPLESHVT